MLKEDDAKKMAKRVTKKVAAAQSLRAKIRVKIDKEKAYKKEVCCSFRFQKNMYSTFFLQTASVLQCLPKRTFMDTIKHETLLLSAILILTG